MPSRGIEDLPKDFYPGQELTADLIRAILQELHRWRKAQAAPPLVLERADSGDAPPQFWYFGEDRVVPFRVTTAVAAGSIGTPTSFTALLLRSVPGGTSFAADSIAETTTSGLNFGPAIPANSNGWAVWRDGHLWPVTTSGSTGFLFPAQNTGGAVAAGSMATPTSGTCTILAASGTGFTTSGGTTGVTFYNPYTSGITASAFMWLEQRASDGLMYVVTTNC